MGKADQLEGSRKGSVGFALTALQRRLASSPEAIYQSLKRRKERLERRLREEKLGIRGRKALAETLADVPEDDDDLNAEEQENLEETLVDEATAAQTIAELEAEIVILEGLEQQAKAVVASGQDRKWDELSKILQNDPEMRDASGRQRKIIIFSEHRDTLNYLHEQDRRRARQPRRHRHHPRRHPPRRTPHGCRRCSAPTPTCASSSPPMPPAKA